MQLSEVNAEATFARLYAIFDTLRADRPATYREDFEQVFTTLIEVGPDAANELVAELLGLRS